MKKQYSVWPTPAPPVTPSRWNQGDWQRFEDRYRPPEYAGDRYDEEAWDRFVASRRRTSLYEPNASEVHARSVALMRFLSDVAQRAHVAEHVYVVGGAVRNYVLGEPIKDIDVVVDSIGAHHDSEWFAREVARALPAATNLTTNQYGVAILTIKGDWALDGHPMKGEVMEIANARAESYGAGGQGYKPTDVRPATIEEDVYRREFTFNTLLWRLSDLGDGPDGAPILDITGRGLRDLERKQILTPSPADQTFSDDPTRMLRAVKFALRYGFEIPESVVESIRRNAGTLRDVPWEPVMSLFVNTVLRTEGALDGLPMLAQLGLLDVLLEIAGRADARAYLSRQMREERRPELLVLMLDAGFALDIPLAKLSGEQRERLLAVTNDMSPEEAGAFLSAVERPAVDNRQIIATLNLPPHDRQHITPLAREVLLESPRLADDPAELTRRVIGGWGALARNAKIVYAAVFLDDESREALLAWWQEHMPPLLPKLYAHHMTIAFKPSPEVLVLLPIGAPTALHVVGWGYDGQAQAVVVQADIPSANPVPHVTVATADGVSPSHSNEMLGGGGWKRTDGPVLRGVVGTYP
jgi:tRNA nucleotidyltransferase/poly(A) polymerase